MKTIIWTIAFLPLLYVAYKLSWGSEYTRWISAFIYHHGGDFLGKMPKEPLRFAADLFGITAIQFLIATLSISPLKAYVKIDLLAYRRLLGLWTFAYALMHSLYFLLLKNAGSPALIYAGMLKHPFVIFGAAALLILAIMALTSPKKLYTKFASWHKPVYFASVLIALHYMLSQKVIDLDVALYVGILAGLLALRLLKR